MPVFLKDKGEYLSITLSGLKGPEFSDALARVKSVPGKRPNFGPDGKFEDWQFPRDADTAMRLMQMLGPVADASVQSLVRDHAAKVAEALVTKLPPDAQLELPWASKLRPYQRAGVDWLQAHPHSIVGDEMGLGKTVQALATIEEARRRASPASNIAARVGPLAEVEGWHDKPTLIVAPKSVRGTWADEIEKWWPNMAYQVVDAKNPSKRHKQATSDVAALIVNWEALRTTKHSILPDLLKRHFVAVIADEAHRAKNRKAQQTKALWKLKAPIQLAMTGTPVMNSPDELWALLRWLRPEVYTGFWPFHYSYVDEYQTRYGTVMTGVKNVDDLRFELKNVLIRRTKRDVLPDLPEKTVQVVPVELTPAERKLYEEVEKALIVDVQRFAQAKVETDIENAQTFTSLDDVPEEQFNKLVATELEKLAALPLETLQGLIPNGAARIVRLRQITSAAKVGYAEEIIRDNPGKPFVTFTWFVPSARDLAERLSKGKPQLKVGTIVGDDEADPVKDAFQAGELDQLVATIAKGGQGLTLTRSDTAIFVDRDWVPDINKQAEDRLHRIGQKNPVSILVLEVPGTVDDGKVAPANRFKSMITSQVLGVRA